MAPLFTDKSAQQAFCVLPQPQFLPEIADVSPRPIQFRPNRPPYEAYARALKLQTERPEYALQARILGYAVLYAILGVNDGLFNLCETITECKNDAALVELGNYYMNFFLRIFKRNSGSSQSPNEHSSQSSIDADTLQLMEELRAAPKDHREAKLAALRRDDFRCAITGLIDYRSWLNDKVTFDPARLTGTGETHAAHVIPEFLNQGLDSDVKSAESSAMYTILKLFCGVSHKDLVGPKIHDISNVITMAVHVHALFDTLHLYFEHDPTPADQHRYRVHVTKEKTAGLAPAFVSFASTGTNLPPPKRRYLEAHAACCRVAHMSGAAEYIEKCLKDLETTKVLSSDGSSSDIFMVALMSIMTPVH